MKTVPDSTEFKTGILYLFAAKPALIRGLTLPLPSRILLQIRRLEKSHTTPLWQIRCVARSCARPAWRCRQTSNWVPYFFPPTKEIFAGGFKTRTKPRELGDVDLNGGVLRVGSPGKLAQQHHPPRGECENFFHPAV
jgi:hypothetical protein